MLKKWLKMAFGANSVAIKFSVDLVSFALEQYNTGVCLASRVFCVVCAYCIGQWSNSGQTLCDGEIQVSMPLMFVLQVGAVVLPLLPSP